MASVLWTDVWIAPYENGHLQAVGTDGLPRAGAQNGPLASDRILGSRVGNAPASENLGDGFWIRMVRTGDAVEGFYSLTDPETNPNWVAINAGAAANLDIEQIKALCPILDCRPDARHPPVEARLGAAREGGKPLADADLALVDLRIPDVGGLDVIRAIREADAGWMPFQLIDGLRQEIDHFTAS